MNQVRQALVRRPAQTIAKGITTANTGLPQYQKAVKQHEQYCKALRDCGLDVIELPAIDEYPDCCFVEDTAVIADKCVVITNPGHPARQGEQHSIEEYFRKNSSLTVQHITEPGYLDGGDVLRLNDTYFIGLSDRTNEAGAKQLISILEGLGLKGVIVPLQGLLHLKTGITAVDRHAVVCIPEIAQRDVFRFVQHKIEVPADEGPGANCLTVGDTVLVAANCKETQRRLSHFGKKVIAVETSEFQKLDAGLTCLSVLF